jgi:hypothetical protein
MKNLITIVMLLVFGCGCNAAQDQDKNVEKNKQEAPKYTKEQIETINKENEVLNNGTEAQKQEIWKQIFISGSKGYPKALIFSKIDDIEFLLDHLDTEEEDVKCEIIAKLGFQKFSTSKDKIKSRLQQYIHDKSSKIRFCVAQSFIWMKDEKESVPIIIELIKEDKEGYNINNILSPIYCRLRSDEARKILRSSLEEIINNRDIDNGIKAYAVIILWSVFNEKIENNKKIIDSAIKAEKLKQPALFLIESIGMSKPEFKEESIGLLKKAAKFKDKELADAANRSLAFIKKRK